MRFPGGVWGAVWAANGQNTFLKGGIQPSAALGGTFWFWSPWEEFHLPAASAGTASGRALVVQSGQSDTTRPRCSFQAVCPGAGWAQKRHIEKPTSGGQVVPGWAQHPPRELGLSGLGPCPAAGAGSADHPLSVLAQMVWASSNRLGCAIHACSNVRVWGSTWRRAVLLVCNYAIK